MFEDSVVSALPSIWASMNSWLTPTVLFVLLNLMIGTIAIASSLGTQKHHDQDPHNQHQHHQGLVRSASVLQRFKSINFYSYRSQEPTTNYEKAPDSDTHEVEELKLVRSPSILQRLQSIKFQFHFPREPIPQQPRDSVLPEPETEAHYASYDHSPEDESSEHEEDESSEHEEAEAEEMELNEDQFGTQEDEAEDQTLDEIYRQLQQEHHVSRTTSDTMPASGEVPAKLPKKMKKSASAKSAFGHFAAQEIVESRRPATVRDKKAKKADHEDDEEVDAKADDFINRFKQQLKLQRIDSIIRYKDMISRGSDK
ncbi:hypothetical protein ACLB2K_010011 [Fragaria x ananassa]